MYFSLQLVALLKTLPGIALLIKKRCAIGGMKEAWIILIGYSGKGLLLVLTQDLAKTVQEMARTFTSKRHFHVGITRGPSYTVLG